MIATAMQAADALIANVALPQLERDLGGGIELGAWVMTSYLCATAVTAPLTGWLRRRYGAQAAVPRRGLGVCRGLAAVRTRPFRRRRSSCCGSLQGAGGGVILPLVQAILLDLYPQERHGRMLGILGRGRHARPDPRPAAGRRHHRPCVVAVVFRDQPAARRLAIWRHAPLRRQRSSARAADRRLRDRALLMIAVGALQLCLERGVGRSWLHSPELLAEAAIAVAAFVAMAARAHRTGLPCSGRRYSRTSTSPSPPSTTS